MIKAARLNASGVFVCIDELADESELTPQHVPSITSCDLPPNRYRWNPGQSTFIPLPSAKIRASELTVTATGALAMLVADCAKHGVPLQPDLVKWFDDWIESMDGHDLASVCVVKKLGKG